MPAHKFIVGQKVASSTARDRRYVSVPDQERDRRPCAHGPGNQAHRSLAPLSAAPRKASERKAAPQSKLDQIRALRAGHINKTRMSIAQLTAVLVVAAGLLACDD